MLLGHWSSKKKRQALHIFSGCVIAGHIPPRVPQLHKPTVWSGLWGFCTGMPLGGLPILLWTLGLHTWWEIVWNETNLVRDCVKPNRCLVKIYTHLMRGRVKPHWCLVKIDTHLLRGRVKQNWDSVKIDTHLVRGCVKPNWYSVEIGTHLIRDQVKPNWSSVKIDTPGERLCEMKLMFSQDRYTLVRDCMKWNWCSAKIDTHLVRD